MQNGCVLFARWQNVSTLRSASSSAQESRRCAWSSGSSGRVVPVARGSVVPTVLWFLSSSCFPRIPFQNWIRVAFHTGRDMWTHVLSCRGNREARSIAGRYLSLQFEFQGSVPGKGEADRNHSTMHVRDWSRACLCWCVKTARNGSASRVE